MKWLVSLFLVIGMAHSSMIIITIHKKVLDLYEHGKFSKQYKIAVGKKWYPYKKKYKITNKKKWPDWRPTKTILKENPFLPEVVKGGKQNPLGARAIYLGWSKYRIHGTNKPWSIGKAVSHGCFRMKNKDVMDLYSRVKKGDTVYINR